MKRFKQKLNSSARSKLKKSAREIEADFCAMKPNSAGIDIGSRSHFVAIPPDRDGEIVKEFASTTSGVLEMCCWLKSHKIETVAMESTGSYWIPVYEILESKGMEVYLVNAKSVKNVPGRKTDVLDCQWIQKLHSVGLLQKSFRPKDHCLKLRALARQHSSLIEHRSPHIQHMQKALHEMNIQLATHIRDITGLTGTSIINAIIKGEQDVKILATLVHPNCKRSAEEIAESLRGNYRKEHLFALKQARDLYDYYTKLIQECAGEIEIALAELMEYTQKISEEEQVDPLRKKPLFTCTEEEQSKKKPKTKSKRKHFSDSTIPLMRGICGIDITTIPGIDQATALKILAEIGGTVEAWKSPKHFASWLGLCPGNKISGGKSLSGATRPCVNQTANLLRLAANGLWNAKCYLGAFLRRMKSRLGGPKAITAAAHKMAIILYTMIHEGKSYSELGEDYYEKTYQARRLKALQKQAKEMNLILVPIHA